MVIKVMKKKASVGIAPKIKSTHKGGRRWLKFAGILGFVFVALVLAFFVAQFFLPSYSVMSVETISFLITIAIVVAIAIIILYYFYFYGFIVLGRYTGSRLIKVSGVLGIVAMSFMLLLLVSGIILRSIGFFLSGEFLGDVSLPLLQFVFIGYAISMLFLLAIGYILSIGLIKVRERVKFAKFSGASIFAISIFNTVSFLFITLIMFNPLFLFDEMVNSLFLYFVSFDLISFVLVLAILIFNSLVLLNASRKFEK